MKRLGGVDDCQVHDVAYKKRNATIFAFPLSFCFLQPLQDCGISNLNISARKYRVHLCATVKVLMTKRYVINAWNVQEIYPLKYEKTAFTPRKVIVFAC